jgi:hypothetical protein
MVVTMTTRGEEPSGTAYEILVRGRLGEDFADELGVTRVEERNGGTLLVIEIIDQSHLHGVLERLGDRNVEIESVNPMNVDKKGVSGGALA